MRNNFSTVLLVHLAVTVKFYRHHFFMHGARLIYIYYMDCAAVWLNLQSDVDRPPDSALHRRYQPLSILFLRV